MKLSSLKDKETKVKVFDRRATYWALYLLPLLWLSLFFVAPLVLMAAFSLRADMRGELLQSWTPTLKQYSELFATGSYWRLLGISTLMALAVALSATLFSYPIAYFLAFRAGRKAGRYLVLLLVPFWTSYLCGSWPGRSSSARMVSSIHC